MRILILTNFYPPYELGGQENSCKQVVDGLTGRGHEVFVLTSTHGAKGISTDEKNVHRLLNLEMELTPWRNSVDFFTKRKRKESENLATLEDLLDRMNSDVVFVWGMWNLQRSLPALAEHKCPGRVVYRFAEYWPTLPTQYELYWRTPGRSLFSRLPKRLLGGLAISILGSEPDVPPFSFEHCICVSAGTRQELVDAGVPVEHARVIHTGLDPERYPKTATPGSRLPEELRILYAGRLTQEKGIETLIEALATLTARNPGRRFSLTVAGEGSADFRMNLCSLVEQRGIKPFVNFLGKVTPSKMPDLYPEFDILVVPSNWPEPFSRVVLEGMITGLVVVSTPLGGSTEILVDGQNGLMFEAGDPDDLSRVIEELAGNADLCIELSRAGRSTVLEQFTDRRMLDEMEDFLLEVTGRLRRDEAVSSYTSVGL